jgi:hypothetical protein
VLIVRDHFERIVLGDGPTSFHSCLRIKTLSVERCASPLESLANRLKIWLRNFFIHYVRVAKQNFIVQFAKEALEDDSSELLGFALHNDVVIKFVQNFNILVIR